MKMKTKHQTKTLMQLQHEAILVLTQKLGLEDTIRFMHANGMATGDYVKERQILLKHVTLEQIQTENRAWRKLNKGFLEELRGQGKLVTPGKATMTRSKTTVRPAR